MSNKTKFFTAYFIYLAGMVSGNFYGLVASCFAAASILALAYKVLYCEE